MKKSVLGKTGFLFPKPSIFSDSEIFTFDAVNDTLTLEWLGRNGGQFLIMV